ncbi:glycosyltransferase [Nocardioides pocheonensis]|nr:glycosyltransferase [Nocardioides pocheonensis]
MADETGVVDSVIALVWARGRLTRWLPTITRLLALPDVSEVVVATDSSRPDDELPAHAAVRVVHPRTFRESLRDVAAGADRPILVVTAPTIAPLDGFGTSRAIMSADLRVASVSFLCNSAGHLSFPNRNRPNKFAVEGHDETSLTRRLRTTDPDLRPVPIHAVAGPATLISRDCVVVTGGPDEEFAGDPEVAVVEMLLRAARRGMRSMLDPATYVNRPWEDEHWGPAPLTLQPVRRRLRELHGFFPRLHLEQAQDPNSPLGLALATARAKAQGLRVMIDASCLGPVENGTQVQTLALIDALAQRDDVRWVGVALAGPIPRYAEKVLVRPKVEVLRVEALRFPPGSPKADVLHRPFQPSRLPWRNWRGVADRIVLTIQDLIAYDIGAYYVPAEWLAYRDNILAGVSMSDGVVVISHDVAESLHQERLPVVEERLFVIENGTDHLTGLEEDEFPAELHERGWAARPFLVVLGANYSHKNRDLAIRTLRILREQRPDLGLVLAGVAVPEGSSRVIEAVESFGAEEVITIPDVTSEERNWLLRHAEICLYPTAAEGFGLVPFEAARFGTPTVFARFGPLAEVLPDVPYAAESWDPAALAAVCEELLGDPQRSRDQVEATLKAGTRYTWEATAEGLVAAYRRLIAEPPRVLPAKPAKSDKQAPRKAADRTARTKE